MDNRAPHSFKAQQQQIQQQQQPQQYPSRRPPEDPKYPPIPPPPYSSQPPRAEAAHNDPFYPRRQTYEPHARSPTVGERHLQYNYPSPSPYTQPPYSASQARTVSEPEARRGSFGTAPLYGHGRREEYNNTRAEDESDHRRTLSHHQQNPLSAPPSQPISTKPHYGPDHSRQSSLNGATQPAMYPSVPNHSPPPPPPYSNRQMLPPSPQYAQPQYSATSQPSRASLPPPPFSRDALASSSHRPGSSMSISSMLGADPETSRDAGPPRGSTLPPVHTTPTSATQPRPPPPYSGSGQSRSRTPDSYSSSFIEQNRATRTYSGGTPQRSYPSYPEGSPESRFGPPMQSSQPPPSTSHYHSSHAESSSQRDSYPAPRRTSLGNLIPPTSRAAQSPTDYERAGRPGSSLDRQAHGGPESGVLSRPPSGYPESRGIPRRDSSEKAYGYSEGRASATSHPQQGLGLRESQTSTQPPMPYPFLSHRAQAQPPQYERRLDEMPTRDRNMDSPLSRRENGNQHHSSLEALRANREPEGRPADHQSLQELRQSLIPALAGENQNARDVQSARILMPSSVSDDQLIAGGDETVAQPKHLSLFPDKRGRASPLPQAMQGAQARLRGPTGETHIKYEFGRVFPGLGSGVGSAVSTPIPSDVQPPRSFPPSPAPGDEGARRTPLGMRDLGDAPSRMRNSSRPAGKKSRKAKDDDIKREGEMDGVGLARTLSGGRGQKRSRQSYHTTSSPLNHHANLAHQNLDQPRRTFTPNQSMASSVSVPHHHHVLHVHHHHTQKAPAPSPVPIPIPVLPSRKPTITINSKAVYDKIKHLPRHHLGSAVYQTTVEKPSIDPADAHSKFGYVSTPVPIPRFDEKENCTFTVRVPRYFLDALRREEICERRALWGAEIYTDDSDPIAVAIHSGWIRGEWDEDVDVSLLDLGKFDQAAEEKLHQMETSNEPSIVMEELPSFPMLPLKNRELHITLLIMPRLESYGSVVSHGLKSRSWKTKHDGMSFKVERIAWVDPKSSKCEARGGEARRKRMRARLYPQSAKGSGPVIDAKLFAIERPKELTASAA